MWLDFQQARARRVLRYKARKIRFAAFAGGWNGPKHRTPSEMPSDDKSCVYFQLSKLYICRFIRTGNDIHLQASKQAPWTTTGADIADANDTFSPSFSKSFGGSSHLLLCCRSLLYAGDSIDLPKEIWEIFASCSLRLHSIIGSCQYVRR